MRPILLLLLAGTAACGPDAEYEQRVIPNDGRLVLDLGGSMMDAGARRVIRACGFDADELQAVQNTRIWFSATDGEFLVDDDPPSAKTEPDGCAEITYVAPEKTTPVTIDAWSGDVNANDAMLSVMSPPTSLVPTATPLSLGPDGGEVVVRSRLTNDGGDPVPNVLVTATATTTGPTGDASLRTDADGEVVHRFNLAESDTITVSDSTGLQQTIQITLASPAPSQLVPDACYYVADAQLEIRGRQFATDAWVTVDGFVAPVTERSSERLVVLLPPSSMVGPVNVVVTNGSGARMSAPIPFTYNAVPNPVVNPSACATGGT